MKVGLFVPCYIDQFYPHIAIATLQLLKKCGCEVIFPLNQTCCGQPMANSGFEKESKAAASLFVENFREFDYIVGAAPSCVGYVREHYDILEPTEEVEHVRKKIYDIAEFLLDVIKIEKIDAKFPHKVGLHQSCHSLRGMRMGQSSEINGPAFSKQKQLLGMVEGLELIELDRTDECCGFGGTFCVTEDAVSAKMGRDRVADHERNGAEVITGGDISCLMHLGGVIRRQQKNIKVIHLVEILNGEIL
ncbi:MAG: (Fe-S)-binding protein [Paludibacter sp.]|nr:(Fe-S)-binding protein [Paludibacter sp.]